VTELSDYSKMSYIERLYSLVGGGAVASGDPSVVSTTPAWRETLVDMTLSASYNDGAPPDVVEAARLNATRWSGLLRELTPGTGTYLNEVCSSAEGQFYIELLILLFSLTLMSPIGKKLTGAQITHVFKPSKAKSIQGGSLSCSRASALRGGMRP
jgi:hypothetical protein